MILTMNYLTFCEFLFSECLMIKCDFAGAYSIFVEDFMLRNIKYIWNGMSYKELKQTIIEGRKVRAFPLVDNPSKSTPLVHLLP